MGKLNKGRAGCGCLLFAARRLHGRRGCAHPSFLVQGLAAASATRTDRAVRRRFRAAVRRKTRTGRSTREAFREYWAGNGKAIWVENDRVLGLTMKEIVARMAKARGIKEGAIKAWTSRKATRRSRLPRRSRRSQNRGSRRWSSWCPITPRRDSTCSTSRGRKGEGPLLFLVKPVEVSYFKTDKWWKDDLSRALMGQNLRVGLLYGNRFGAWQEEEKDPAIPGERKRMGAGRWTR